MNQEEVQMFEAELFKGFVKGTPHSLRAVIAVTELARDVQFLPGNAGDCDPLAHAALVPVHLGGVDVPVSEFKG